MATPIAVALPSVVPPAKVSRDTLLAGFKPGSPTYRGIDRKEAKLVTQGELLRELEAVGASVSGTYAPGTGPDTIVWVVVVAGDIEPDFAHGQKALWEVSWYSADTGRWVGNFWSRQDGKWPQFWTNLPDRDPSRR